MTRHSFWKACSQVLGVVALAAGFTAAAAAQVQDGEFFPNTRSHGQASVRYNDGEIDFVANYVYSQFNHDSRWLMIEAGLTTDDRMVIHREDIKLITPEGREIPMSTQRRFREDSGGTQRLLQNSTTSTRPMLNYFTRRTYTDDMRFFTRPGGGTVQDEFLVDNNTVVIGVLFFEAPTGAWDRGVYRLVIQGEDGVTATLPIDLQ